MPSLDFTAIKQQVRMHEVLALLGWQPTGPWGSLMRGPCPIHRSKSDGSKIFAVSYQDWYCHKCRCGGGPVDLYHRVTGLPIYAATLQLCERIGMRPIWLPRAARTHKAPEQEEAR